MTPSWVVLFGLYEFNKYLAYISVLATSWVSITIWKGKAIKNRKLKYLVNIIFSLLMVTSLSLTMELSYHGEIDKLVFLVTQALVALILASVIMPFDEIRQKD